MRTILVVVMLITVCSVTEQARAQSAADKAAAEQLFQEGRRLMQQGQYESAISKFQASIALEPGSGTQGNIALCYKRLGKLASAWGHYRETAARAEREGNTERARVARELADELEPRLPRLIIRLSSRHTTAGLAVTRNGMPVPEAVLGIAVYVDPGEHEISATAPGYQQFSKTITVAEAEERTIEVPELVPKPGADPVSREQPSDRLGKAEPRRSGEKEQPLRDVGRPRRRAGWITGGAGLIALGTGLAIGTTAISSWDEAFKTGMCNPDTLLCTPEGQEQTNTARSRARLSNILVGAGVTAAAVGAVLYFTAPKAGRQDVATRLIPFTATDTLGIAVLGGF